MLAVLFVMVIVLASVSSKEVEGRRREVERAVKTKTFFNSGEQANGLDSGSKYKEGKPQISQLSHTRPHPVFPVPSWSVRASSRDADSSMCDVNTNLWECLGSDRDWGLVSLMDKEGEKRMDSIARLLTRTQLMVVTTYRTRDLPADFKLSNKFWHGRRCFSQTLDEDKLTVLIQGDLDTTGEIFDSVLDDMEKESSEEIQSKLAMLLVASLSTPGDILELGTDQDTTELLHTVVQSDNAKQEEDDLTRMLVTSDSTSSWLSEHSALLCSFHQFVFVPLYNNGAGCAHHHQPRELHGKRKGQAAQKITCKHLEG